MIRLVRFLEKYRFHILILFISFFVITRFYFDPDLGWHLAIGNKFLTGGGIIFGDQFSWTMPGYVWGNYFFAYEILVAFLFSHIGFLAIAILFGVLGSLSVLLLLPREVTPGKIPIIFLGILVSSITLGVRPSMVSFWMFCLLLYLLERHFFEKKAYSIFWFLFFALWVNFHQGFLAGLFVFFLYCSCDLLVRKSYKKKVDIFSMALCFLAGVLGTLATPFHFLVYKSIFLDLSGTKTWAGIAEWQPVALDFPVNFFLGISGALFIFILLRSFRKIQPQWFIVACFLFAISFMSANMLLFWGAIFIFIASRHFDLKVNLKLDKFLKIPLVLSFLAVFLAFIFNFIFQVMMTWNLSTRLYYDYYPTSAVEFMKKEGISSRIFNDYKWGGYLDFFYPEAKVFIDGRMTGWRTKKDYLLADSLDIMFGKCGPLTKYNPKAALLDANFSEKCFRDFRVVYRDNVAKVLVKK